MMGGSVKKSGFGICIQSQHTSRAFILLFDCFSELKDISSLFHSCL